MSNPNLPLADDDLRRISDLAREVRASVLRMTNRGRASHVASSLSIADILAVLYDHTLRIDPRNPTDRDRDRLLVSKGHAAAALYAVLAHRGFFPLEWLDRYHEDGQPLGGHVTSHGVPGVELSTGALGHGLPVAAGMALAAQLDGRESRAVALLSDGECDEGSVWEAALFAAHHQLGNLTVVVDYNKLQSLGTVESTLALEPFADKWRAFGWSVDEIDGHDLSALASALAVAPGAPRPKAVLAHTVKGRGVSFMENLVLWHYRPPGDDDLSRALAELGVS